MYPTGATKYEAEAHLEQQLGVITPRLLLYEKVGGERTAIESELRRSGLRVDWVMVDADRPAAPVARAAVDVAAVKLSGERCAGLAYAAELALHAPWVQFVFWVSEETPPPSAYAARSLGINRLVPGTEISRWLAQALVPLARLSRAQRAVMEAEATIPGLPEVSFRRRASPMALPEAERQFRESYLRRLLSESPTAKKAAERAGVPYTTLCSMMKKLGLSRGDP